MPLMAQLLVAITGFGLLAAATTDLRWRIIPNALVAALLAAAVMALAIGLIAPAGGALLGALAVFVAGAVLFAAGAMGGGDVKLLAVTSLWAAPDRLLEFLVLTTLLGGALALGLIGLGLLAGRLGTVPGFGPLAMPSKATVPYGVAIALAGIWVLGTLG